MQRPSIEALALLAAGGALLAAWLASPRGDKRLRSQLTAMLRGKRPELAAQAVAEMRARGWLHDGSLRGAIMTGSQLAWSDLTGSDLSGVWLGYSSLEGCCLRGANLEAADLRLCDLQGADLRDANLRNANLVDVVWDTVTRLPHGGCWTPDTDLARFTDSRHREYWNPQSKLLGA